MDKCNRDCFHCPFPDCVAEIATTDERKESTERDREARRERNPVTKWQKAYRKRIDYQKAYRKRNREKRNAYRRAYYRAHREKELARDRAYYLAHKEEYIEWQRERRVREKLEGKA